MYVVGAEVLSMKPSERYQLDRLARELSRPQGWIDADPPTWVWPQREIAGNSLAARVRRMGD